MTAEAEAALAHHRSVWLPNGPPLHVMLQGAERQVVNCYRLAGSGNEGLDGIPNA